MTVNGRPMGATGPHSYGRGAAIGALLIVAWALALQGWGGRLLTLDCIPGARQASAFLEKGILPTHDCLTSLGSYLPPGTAWLLVPGLALFRNPLLAGYPASLSLYTLTLIGAYKLGKRIGGQKTAWGAVFFYGLSGGGLTSAASLWPRFPPAAGVWMAYWLVVWVVERRAWALPAGLVCWALGLYVHLEGLLFLPVFPVVWWIWRPPVKVASMAAALALILAVWLPYIGFERGRGGADLRSMLLRQSLIFASGRLPPDFASTVERRAPGVTTTGATGGGASKHGRSLGVRMRATIIEWVDRGLSVVRSVPPKLAATLFCPEWAAAAGMALGGGIFMFAVARAGPALARLHAAGPSATTGNAHSSSPAMLGAQRARILAGSGVLLLALLVNPWTVGRCMSANGVLESYTRHVVWVFQGAMVLCGVLLLFWAWIANRVRTWVGASHLDAAVVAVTLLIPWMGALWMASGDEPYRFWLLWPLQVTMLAAGVVWLGSRCRARVLQAALVVACGVPVASNTVIVQRVEDWHREGWRGTGQLATALDALGTTIAGAHDPAPRIGYFVGQADWVRQYHALDAQYKIGLQMDWYLERRHGVTNALLAAGGRDGSEDYRLLKTGAQDGARLADAPPDADWVTVATNSHYVVRCRRRCVQGVKAAK